MVLGNFTRNLGLQKGKKGPLAGLDDLIVEYSTLWLIIVFVYEKLKHLVKVQ